MKLELLANCPVCNNTTTEEYLQVKDNTVSSENFKIVACTSCGFLFTNPRPKPEFIGSYYESNDYISHHDEAKDLLSTVYKKVRDYTTDQKIALINSQVTPTGELLDIGCGTGFFLSRAQQKGWNVSGTEPDQNALQVASSRVGDNIHSSINAPELANRTFSVITLWHVLEHVHLLNETIQWLHTHLTENGKLFIAVPNPESEDAQKFKQHWAAYDVPRHLYHFSKKAMSQLLKKHNFKIEKIKPMWFDSYYVSLLSTKYQSGQSALLQSFLAGTLSNWKGKKSSSTDYNTSSLIYIISKA